MSGTCKICGDKLRDNNGYRPELGTNSGPVHLSCAVQVVDGFIAKRPKEPTLEERVESHLIECWGMGDNRQHVEAVIAMVREHDAVSIDPSDNDHARIARLVEGNAKLKARAEAAEAKLAAIRSELSTD